MIECNLPLKYIPQKITGYTVFHRVPSCFIEYSLNTPPPNSMRKLMLFSNVDKNPL